MSEELKPKSFRINDETAERIKRITEEIGGNQQQALAKLIESYEFQKGKVILTERSDDIDRFEKLVTQLTRMYMNVLEDNQCITDSVRTEFDALLNSKDSTIQDLQTSNKNLTDTKNKAIEESTNLKKVNGELIKQLEALQKQLEEEIKNSESIIADKDQLNAVLLENNRSLKLQNESVAREVLEARKIKHYNEELERHIGELNIQNSQLQKDLAAMEKTRDEIIQKAEKNLAAIEKARIEAEEVIKKEAAGQLKEAIRRAEFQKDQALFKLKQQYEVEIQNLKKERQAEIDNYQQQYFTLLNRLSKFSKKTEEIEGELK